MKDEARYTCESCGEEIVVPIDVTAGASQTSRIALARIQNLRPDAMEKTYSDKNNPNAIRFEVARRPQ